MNNDLKEFIESLKNGLDIKDESILIYLNQKGSKYAICEEEDDIEIFNRTYEESIK
jgi:hypothetical protein